MKRSLRLTILLDLLVASLIPMGIAVALASYRSHQALKDAARENVQLLANVTAARLDQLILDSLRTVQIAAVDDQFHEFCANPAARPGIYSQVMAQLSAVVDTNSDYSNMFLTNADGIGLISTNPHNIGQDITFRDYFRIARQGHANASHWLVSKSAGEPGVYFAAPITGDEAQVVGVAALKLRGARVSELIREVHLGEGGYAFLADDNGIVLAHPDRSKHLHSFAKLTKPQLEQIDPPTRFGQSTIETLDMPELQTIAESKSARGTAEFTMPPTGDNKDRSTWMAGYASLKQEPWKVFVVQPTAQFDRTVMGLAYEQLQIALIVAIVGVLISMWRAQSLVRPLMIVTRAARQLASGNFAARADVKTTDEVGLLAKTFNQMVPQLEQRMELQQSVELAQKVQQNLLPQEMPQLEGLDVAGRSRYCDATGGDYFDFAESINLPEGQQLVAVGDVTGHGFSAALLMCTARAALRTAAWSHGSLGNLLTRVNVVLSQGLAEDMFMTMTLLTIDSAAGTIRYACAAHDAIVIYEPMSKTLVELKEGSVPLGVDPNWRYEEYEYDGLLPGTVVFIGTDGIWEASNPQDKMFGRDRMIDAIKANAHRTAAEIGLAVEEALERFLEGRPIQDDVTYVVLKVIGAPSPDHHPQHPQLQTAVPQ